MTRPTLQWHWLPSTVPTCLLSLDLCTNHKSVLRSLDSVTANQRWVLRSHVRGSVTANQRWVLGSHDSVTGDSQSGVSIEDSQSPGAGPGSGRGTCRPSSGRRWRGRWWSGTWSCAGPRPGTAPPDQHQCVVRHNQCYEAHMYLRVLGTCSVLQGDSSGHTRTIFSWSNFFKFQIIVLWYYK